MGSSWYGRSDRSEDGVTVCMLSRLHRYESREGTESNTLSAICINSRSLRVFGGTGIFDLVIASTRNLKARPVGTTFNLNMIWPCFGGVDKSRSKLLRQSYLSPIMMWIRIALTSVTGHASGDPAVALRAGSTHPDNSYPEFSPDSPAVQNDRAPGD